MAANQSICPDLSVLDFSGIPFAIARDARAVLAAPAVLLGKAMPPSTSGVYIFSVGDKITYVGEAKGRKGLKDRLKSKHISGDDNHAVQRAYMLDFPDRLRRREHIKATVFARWAEIDDLERVSAVERLLIRLYRPTWNRR